MSRQKSCGWWREHLYSYGKGYSPRVHSISGIISVSQTQRPWPSWIVPIQVSTTSAFQLNCWKEWSSSNRDFQAAIALDKEGVFSFKASILVAISSLCWLSSCNTKVERRRQIYWWMPRSRNINSLVLLKKLSALSFQIYKYSLLCLEKLLCYSSMPPDDYFYWTIFSCLFISVISLQLA